MHFYMHLYVILLCFVIGRHISLLDPKWANGVEFLLKGLLNKFICNSTEDRKTLEQLCRRNNLSGLEVITYRYMIIFFL